jgi:hypothetical protein
MKEGSKRFNLLPPTLRQPPYRSQDNNSINFTRFDLAQKLVRRLEAPAGSYPAVIDGYYLPMNPLPPGEHQLQYKIVYAEPSAGPLKKYVPGEVKYSLIVKP